MEQFKQYFLGTLKERYAQFNGRASRSEFWYFILFYIIVSILVSILDTVFGTSYTYEFAANSVVTENAEMASVAMTHSIGYLATLFGLLMLVPTLAISIRRLHDSGKSGWWILLSIIPIINLIGFFVLLFFYVQESQSGENMYGLNPTQL